MCHGCGEVEIHGKGARYCAECHPLYTGTAEQRKRARARVRSVKPCRGCGGAKPAGRRRSYCDRCVAERSKPRPCDACGVRPRPAPRLKLCVVCKARAVERRRAQHREYQRRQRARFGHEPKGSNQAPEVRRMNRRLRMEQEGGALTVVTDTRPKAGNLTLRAAALFPDLPPQPLGRAIAALARREQYAEEGFAFSRDVDRGIMRGVVALRLGLAKTPELCAECRDKDEPCKPCRVVLAKARAAAARRLYAWEHGEVDSLRFDTVDRILTLTGWLWFDVYEPCPGGLEHRQAITAEGECPMCRAHALAERAFTSTAVEPQLQLEAAA